VTAKLEAGSDGYKLLIFS